MFSVELYEYLKLIQPRVYLYIGSQSLKDLQVHILGFQTAEWKHSLNKFLGTHAFDAFVNDQYQMDSCKGWPAIILEKMDGNVDNALAEFYRLLDLFYLPQIQ